ncbi:MAG: SMC-Scp complex subunit ScpB [Ignavibacteriae bacterium]|nr:SMC-Scp complex subunit ScpB [Ignavibacteriota bacterium]
MTGEQGTTLKQIIEALLFATDEPLSVREILDILGEFEAGELPQRRINEQAVLDIVEQLNKEYEATSRSMHIVKVAGGYQFATLPQYAMWLGKMLREKTKRKLSVSALESLAVIAYKQPVTKPEIESIRGVNADYVIRSLMERNMITIVGRAASPGRPLLYGTTKEFLKHFGLNDLSELPKPREIEELMAEAEFEVEKQLLREQEAKAAEANDGGELEEGDDDTRIVVSEDGTLRKVDTDDSSGESEIE